VGIVTSKIQVKTKGENNLIDLTPRLAEFVKKSGLHDGLATAFVGGSTAAITTIEYEPGLEHDLAAALERLIPRNIGYKHHEKWGDDNGRSHIRAAFLKPSVSVPFTEGKLMLGTWQQVVLVELDTRPREREVVLQFIGE
jgi:secondary thiamine-phosphate synthase enzyme